MDNSQYVTQLFAQEDEALRRAREDSAQRGLPAISVRAEEGRFLQVLVRSVGAVRALEIGTLGGYSGIWIARGLAPGGHLLTLEQAPLHAEVASEHFAFAGVQDRVEIRVGDAHQNLRALDAEAPFDFVFIDAEKGGYPDYLAWAVEHTRLGGVITAHNTLRGGAVAAGAPGDEAVQGMRRFNQMAADEPRLLSTIYPAGDGMLVAVKVAM